jgi:hypothetical protein
MTKITQMQMLNGSVLLPSGLLVSNMNCPNASQASHGAAQVAIHSQLASQGTVVVNVHNVDMVMY